VIKDVSVGEDKGKKSATLFGENFMENATKRMEEEKACMVTQFLTVYCSVDILCILSSGHVLACNKVFVIL